MKTNTKRKILESLEGKRTEAVWELIEKAVNEIYGGFTEEKLERAKKEYFELEYNINDKTNRYMIVEQYNLIDGFYAHFYGDKVNFKGQIPFEEMFEEYFSDTDGWEQILCVDMKEMKCYRIDKEISYPVQEVKIK